MPLSVASGHLGSSRPCCFAAGCLLGALLPYFRSLWDRKAQSVGPCPSPVLRNGCPENEAFHFLALSFPRDSPLGEAHATSQERTQPSSSWGPRLGREEIKRRCLMAAQGPGSGLPLLQLFYAQFHRAPDHASHPLLPQCVSLCLDCGGDVVSVFGFP